ncbi:hypothetical protein RS030_101641 [Cryptosporidium xiaoi]|uniref:Mediator of RNA polymerase II transcription subunit 14 n=1 Tax=Cryptosporidium xiaoi TaxID=659607 RepID=A0AAV9Y354_9CRYT
MRLTNEETEEFQKSFVPISYGYLSRQIIEHSYSEFLDLIGRSTTDPNIQEEARTCLWEYSAEIREIFLRMLAIGNLSRILEDINRVIQERESILSLRFKLRKLSYDLFPALTIMGSPNPNIKASIDMLKLKDYCQIPSLLYELAVQNGKQIIVPKLTDLEKENIERRLRNEFMVQYKKSDIIKSSNVNFSVNKGRIIIEKKSRFLIKIISDLKQWQIIDARITIPELSYYYKINTEHSRSLKEILQAKLYIINKKTNMIKNKLDLNSKLIDNIAENDGDSNSNSKYEKERIMNEIQILEKDKKNNEDVLGEIFKLSNTITGEIVLEILLEQSILCIKEERMCGIYHSEMSEYHFNDLKYKYLDIYLYSIIDLNTSLLILNPDNYSKLSKYKLNKSEEKKSLLYSKSKNLAGYQEIILRFLMLPNGEINCILWPLSLYINNTTLFNDDIVDILNKIKDHVNWLYLCNLEKDNSQCVLDLSKILNNVSKIMRYFVIELCYNMLINNEYVISVNSENINNIKITLDKNGNYILINIYDFSEYIVEFDIFSGSLLIKDLTFDQSIWRDYPVYYENLIECIKINANFLSQVLPYLIKLTKYQKLRNKLIIKNNWLHITNVPENVKNSIKHSYIDENNSYIENKKHILVNNNISQMNNRMVILNTVIDNILTIICCVNKINEKHELDIFDLFFYVNPQVDNLKIIYIRINIEKNIIELIKLFYMSNNPYTITTIENFYENYKIFGINNLDYNNFTNSIKGKVIIGEFDLEMADIIVDEDYNENKNIEDLLISRINNTYSNYLNNNIEIIKFIESIQNIKKNVYYDVYNKYEDKKVLFKNSNNENNTYYDELDTNIYATNNFDILSWFFPFKLYSIINNKGIVSNYDNNIKEYDLLFQLYKYDVVNPKVEFKIQIIKKKENNDLDEIKDAVSENFYYYKLVIKTNQNSEFNTFYMNGFTPIPFICSKKTNTGDNIHKLSDNYFVKYSCNSLMNENLSNNDNNILNKWGLVDKISLIFINCDNNLNDMLYNLRVLLKFIHIILETIYLCYYTIPNNNNNVYINSNKFYSYYTPIQRSDFKIINIFPWKLDIQVIAWPFLFGDHLVNQLLKLLNYESGSLSIYLIDNSINVLFFDKILNNYFINIYTKLILDYLYNLMSNNKSTIRNNKGIIECYWDVIKTYEILITFSILQYKNNEKINELLINDFNGSYDSFNTIKLKNILAVDKYIISFGLRDIGMQILLLIELDKKVYFKLKIKLYDVLNLQNDGSVVKQSKEVINHTKKLLDDFISSNSCYEVDLNILNDSIDNIRNLDYFNYNRLNLYMNYYNSKTKKIQENELYYYPGHFFNRFIKSLSQFFTLSFYISIVSGVTQRKINNLVNHIKTQILNKSSDVNKKNGNNTSHRNVHEVNGIIYINDEEDDNDNIEYYHHLLQNIKQPILNWSGQNKKNIIRSSKFDNYYIKQPVIEFTWFYCKTSTIDVNRRHILIFNRRWENPIMYFDVPKYIRYKSSVANICKFSKNNNSPDLNCNNKILAENNSNITDYDQVNYSDLYNINEENTQKLYWPLEYDMPKILIDDNYYSNLSLEFFGNEIKNTLSKNNDSNNICLNSKYDNATIHQSISNKRLHSELQIEDENNINNKKHKYDYYNSNTTNLNDKNIIVPFLCFPENIRSNINNGDENIDKLILMSKSYYLELLTSPISSEFEIFGQFLLLIGKRSSSRTLIRIITVALCSSLMVIKDVSLLFKYPLLSLQNKLPIYVDIICQYDDVLVPIDKVEEKTYFLKGLIYRIWKLNDPSTDNSDRDNDDNSNNNSNNNIKSNSDFKLDVIKNNYVDIFLSIRSIPVNDINDIEINGFSAGKLFPSIKTTPHLSILSIILDKLFHLPFEELVKFHSFGSNKSKYLQDSSLSYNLEGCSNINIDKVTSSNNHLSTNKQHDNKSIDKVSTVKDKIKPQSKSQDMITSTNYSQDVIEIVDEDDYDEPQIKKQQCGSISDNTSINNNNNNNSHNHRSNNSVNNIHNKPLKQYVNSSLSDQVKIYNPPFKNQHIEMHNKINNIVKIQNGQKISEQISHDPNKFTSNHQNIPQHIQNKNHIHHQQINNNNNTTMSSSNSYIQNNISNHTKQFNSSKHCHSYKINASQNAIHSHGVINNVNTINNNNLSSENNCQVVAHKNYIHATQELHLPINNNLTTRNINQNSLPSGIKQHNRIIYSPSNDDFSNFRNDGNHINNNDNNNNNNSQYNQRSMQYDNLIRNKPVNNNALTHSRSSSISNSDNNIYNSNNDSNNSNNNHHYHHHHHHHHHHHFGSNYNSGTRGYVIPDSYNSSNNKNQSYIQSYSSIQGGNNNHSQCHNHVINPPFVQRNNNQININQQNQKFSKSNSSFSHILQNNMLNQNNSFDTRSINSNHNYSSSSINQSQGYSGKNNTPNQDNIQIYPLNNQQQIVSQHIIRNNNINNLYQDNKTNQQYIYTRNNSKQYKSVPISQSNNINSRLEDFKQLPNTNNNIKINTSSNLNGQINGIQYSKRNTNNITQMQFNNDNIHFNNGNFNL